MKALASSSFQTDQTGQHAGAHSGLTHTDGGPLNPPASAPSGEVAEQAQALFTRCGWCKAVMVDGPLSPEGLESTGICAECADRMTADTIAAIKVYPPLHVIPAQDRIGGYIIRDDNDRLIVDNLSGVNSAAAIAHILNNAIHGYGLCLLHLNERRQDGTCFGCLMGAPRHPFAAVGQ